VAAEMALHVLAYNLKRGNGHHRRTEAAQGHLGPLQPLGDPQPAEGIRRSHTASLRG
jgi:hypothetical protein